MPLFQQSVLKKYIADLNKADLQAAYTLFAAHFLNPVKQENIRNLKEEEYQEGFVRDLFVAVLGYTLNPQPDYNFVLEKKTVTDATKSDGAIIINKEVVAVIELKDTGTPDLEKVSTQAFGYKHKHKNCQYVITSNFEKLRFYINDATDFEEFNLFALSQDRFALLYLCLHQKQLQQNIPLQVKQNSTSEEQNVTKKLYADYSSFKRQLFQQIAGQNEQYDKLLLFKKTQKLLDRFLFIFFAEDRMLLPPNSVREILAQWQQLKDLDNYVPLYDRFKKYFGYLNKGHIGKHHEIFAYNGGLFSEDDVLDNIVIDDEILYNGTKTLSNYDFDTDVDVNILGHIFEHSLTEIEELQSELKGQAVEKNKTKRKKEGVFYTPRYITKYIVENTVGTLCTQKKEELQINEETFAPQKRKTQKKLLLDKIDAYREWLLQLTICDPACGSGAFLNAALEFLKAEHRTADELKARIFGDAIVYTDIDNSILENNLFGVDINEDAIEIAKLSLWLHTAKKGRKLSNLSNNIKVGNSLIDDETVAGDKAFTWKDEFKHVFDKAGFDVVIGNPPYGAVFNSNEKKQIVSQYQTYKYKFESYIYFFERGVYILKQKGYLGYITPELWLSLENCEPLREFIYNAANLAEINVIGENVFVDAVVNTVITILTKDKTKSRFLISYKDEKWEVRYDEWNEVPTKVIEYRVNKKLSNIIKKVESNSIHLRNLGEAIQGITPYDKYRGQDEDIIKSRGFHYRYKKDETCGKWLNGEDINRYTLKWGGEWLSYGNWLGAAREPKFFIGNRILFREIPGSSRRIQAVIANEIAYYGHSITPFILHNKEDIYLLKKLLCLMNSTLISWYGSIKLPNFGKEVFPKLNPQDIKLLPVYNRIEVEADVLVDKADLILERNKELIELVQQFIKLMEAKFLIIKINNKLQSWPSLRANEFLKELEKQKIKFSLPEQQEWLQYFAEQKAKANNIQQVIKQTDKEIDDLVYELYGLSEEEIRIVEGEK